MARFDRGTRCCQHSAPKASSDLWCCNTSVLPAPATWGLRTRLKKSCLNPVLREVTTARPGSGEMLSSGVLQSFDAGRRSQPAHRTPRPQQPPSGGAPPASFCPFCCCHRKSVIIMDYSFQSLYWLPLVGSQQLDVRLGDTEIHFMNDLLSRIVIWLIVLVEGLNLALC